MADDTYRDDDVTDDGIQHGIDDSPTGDAEKGAVLGGLGGAAAGAAAGSMAGPMGALAGAAIGGVAGAVASGLAVGAVDRIDNDNTISGIGDGSTSDVEDQFDADKPDYSSTGTYGTPVTNDTYGSTSNVPSSNAGDLGASDNDNFGARRVAQDFNTNTDMGDPSRDNWDASIDNGVPGVQTGGVNADGSPDTRGIMEKTADTVTGDDIDDKTGKPV